MWLCKGLFVWGKENESNKNYVQDILDCNADVIDNDTLNTAQDVHDETNVNIDISETNMNVKTSNAQNIPLNSYVWVKPLAKKQVTKILTAACGAYSSFSEEQCFEISNLALKLQEVNGEIKAKAI